MYDPILLPNHGRGRPQQGVPRGEVPAPPGEGAAEGAAPALLPGGGSSVSRRGSKERVPWAADEV